MKYLVCDIECTCWNKNDPNKQPHETIEIGAVLLNEDFVKIDQLDIFTMPKYNKTLSNYCIDLTGITQEMLDTNAIPFPEAISILIHRIAPTLNHMSEVVLCAWGDFDKNQLKKDCEEWNIEFPFTDEYINVKKEFSKVLGHKKCGLQKACTLMALRFNGSPHRGIDDAGMVAEILYRIKKGQ